MSSYLYLGQIKRGIDRGLLLNQALGRIHDAPNRDRKGKVLDGLEVAEVVTIMELTDAMKSLFMLHRQLYEEDPEQGMAAMRRGLYDVLVQQLPGEAVSVMVAQPTQAPPVVAQPLARPLAPVPDSTATAPVRSPQVKQPASVDDSEPPMGSRSILSGMMSLRTNTNT